MFGPQNLAPCEVLGSKCDKTSAGNIPESLSNLFLCDNCRLLQRLLNNANPCFLCVPLLFQGFYGIGREENPCLSRGFLAFSLAQRKDWRVRVHGDRGTAREILLEKFSQAPFAHQDLQDATEELKGDPEIIMAAVSKAGIALQYATEELKGDPVIVMKAVSKDGYALQYAKEKLKGDPEIVMKAVSQIGDALQYATEELKGDPEIVMKAVSQTWLALSHATEDVKGDEKIMRLALEQCPQGLVGLHISLLSGRGCHDIFAFVLHNRTDVLRRCAKLLDLDPDDVLRRGVLMSGSVEVQMLHELEPGKLLEITLVLS